MPALIFMVDDDADIRTVVTHILHGAGHQVVTASTGAEALAILPTIQPDLLLLDVNLPDGEGPALYQQMIAVPSIATLPVIWVTAYQGIVPGLPYDHPQMVVMTKPFAMDALVRMVAELLAATGPRGGLGPNA